MINLFPLEEFLADDIIEQHDLPSVVNMHSSLFILCKIAYEEATRKYERTLFYKIYKALEDYSISYKMLSDWEIDCWYPLKSDTKSVKGYARSLNKHLNMLK